ncbi:hypothetical protein FB567DRAFT_574186 [Paraphoma chrysanthemicola]|uniref:Uncharacterized protein n=1 Tax=Paraphoma chrysanthemicola TaxID=798071 RepID=A0A8K0QRJ5_9PLEO|nr:hypothetical protein FB567DRAFT_574186 [Paraphoma chrysanthemicola]
MSGSTPNRSNRAPSGTYPPSDYNASPRHGRIRSRTIDSPGSPQGAQRAYPAGPTSPPQAYRPIPTVMYGPNQRPNDLQRFVGQSMEPFLRWAFAIVDERGRVHPNHNYLPDIDNAVYWSETIDAFNRDPRLMHELILRISNRDLGHPVMESIRQNRSIRYGQTVQQARAEYARRKGVELMPDRAEWPRLKFPSWCRKETKGSETEEGRGKNKSGGMEGKPFWGAPGDGRPRGPPGGAAGGGIAL